MKLDINQTLSAGTSTVIDFPHRWSSVKAWHVKWDTFHYTLKDGTEHEIRLDNDTSDVVDWRHPVSVRVRDAKGTLLDEAEE